MQVARLLWVAAPLALAVAVPLAPAALAATPDQQRARESAFDAQIDPTEQTQWLKILSSAPNHVGSPHDKANADLMLAKFREWGWDARIETFQVLYPTPISTTIELIGTPAAKLGGQEPPIPGDSTSQDLSGALPPYVAFQGDGDVTADLVYVNYGMPSDYDELARRGISVKGKIAIARYGAGWRGLKPKLAQEHGAIGCLIYSDPADDGYGGGDPYPRGGARPPHSVQRGSVEDMTTYPGDPLTPGVGATAGAKRLTRAQAITILKIPTLPVSYADAQVLLAGLRGPFAPSGWRGGLPIPYHMGGDGTVKVRLAVKSDWSLKPVYDVIGVMKGASLPDEWVVRGNHRDGWVFGASDPLSGHVAMMAEAKAIGALAKTGWRPARTIVYASWDGEEPGLIGSTEWAETHAAELKAKAVVYINSDNIGRGFLHASGTHSWQHLVNSVAADVTDPETGVSVARRSRGAVLAQAYDGQGGRRGSSDTLKAAESGGDLPIGPLGSGSDYTAFLQHLGIASLDIGYGGEDEAGGVYHSAYDSFDHYTRFDDPGLKYAATLAKTVGRLVLRTADADTPPVRFGDFATTVGHYVEELKILADERRTRDRTLAKLSADDAFRLASDPLKPVAAPGPLAATPHIEFAPLEDSADRLKVSAAAFDSAYADKGARLAPAVRTRLNAALRDIDQLLLLDKGLPGRPWFKNSVYAPGRLTGYGAKTLPAVREAIEDRRFAEASDYAAITAKALDAFAARLDMATGILNGR